MSRKIARAREAYREFHWGIPPRKISRASVPKIPRALVQLGTLEEVVYKTNKRGDGTSYYRHKFEARRPRLAMDVDNKRLHVVGGGYTVTERGIEG